MAKRICNQCNLAGKENLFVKDKNLCKICSNANRRESNKRNKLNGTVRVEPKIKICRECNFTGLNKFFIKGANWCKNCHNTYRKRKRGNRTIRKFNNNLEIFTNKDRNSFYLLGAYMTDGWVSRAINRRKNKTYKYWTIGIVSKDKEWIEAIRDLISPGRTIYKRKKAYTLQFNDTKIAEWLISWGCIPRKSLNLKLTKKIPKKFQMDFLRGAMDGDGSICRTISRRKTKRLPAYYQLVAYICSASNTFIKQLETMIPSNIQYTIQKKDFRNKEVWICGKKVKGNCIMRYLNFTGTYARKLLDLIYYDDCKLALPRKKKLAAILKAH